MIKPEILFLQQEDVIEAGLLDMKEILMVTEDTFRKIGEGKVKQPSKIFMTMPDDENWQSFSVSMPAYIGGDEDVVGFKWAAESKFNATQQGMPYGVDIVVLSDPKTMYPKAFLDGTLTTAMRTSAAAGVCAKYTARKNSRVATLIGAGVIGRTMIMSIAEAVPGLEEIRIVDLDYSKAANLALEFKGKYPVAPCSDVEIAMKDADLVVSETTSQKEFISADWIKKNATVIQMEPRSFMKEAVLSADRIIVDSWEQIVHVEIHSFAGLNKSGALVESDVNPLQDVVLGKIKGRENDDQRVFCCTLGMGAVDIAIADRLYKRAQAKGLGKKLLLWENPLWV